jgi:DNA polymerase V
MKNQPRGRGRPRGEPTKVVRLPVPVIELARRFARRPMRAGDINRFLDIHTRTKRVIPLVGSKVAAGFPSPADDYLDRALDFNELLVENPAATFAVRVAGDSMIGAGIFADDIAIVDRSRSPVDRCIVLALVDGEFTLKRYRRRAGKVWLQAENPSYKDIQITDGMTFEVWGVVSKAIRML